MDRRVIIKVMRLVDRTGMAVITAILSYCASQVTSLTTTVETLSKNVAVILEKYDSHSLQINDLKERVTYIERTTKAKM